MKRRQVLASMLGGLAAGVMTRPAFGANGIGEVLEAVGTAGFIAIGERHDNPGHHRLQAELVAALAPAGLAFEMIPRAHEDTVNRMRAEGAPVESIGEAIGWAASGWPDWSHYAPILDAAPDAYIAGGGLSKAELGVLYAEGASGLGAELTERYNLDAPLPVADREAMLDAQYEAHCGLIARDKLGAMVEIQRAWDAAYAEAWRRAEQNGRGRAVLICGNEHARLDQGAPAYLKSAVPDAAVASVGMLETGEDPPPEGRFTATLSASRPDREDPCETMRKAMEKG